MASEGAMTCKDYRGLREKIGMVLLKYTIHHMSFWGRGLQRAQEKFGHSVAVNTLSITCHSGGRDYRGLRKKSAIISPFQRTTRRGIFGFIAYSKAPPQQKETRRNADSGYMLFQSGLERAASKQEMSKPEIPWGNTVPRQGPWP